MNWDHVFPLARYPDTTPANEEKWKIPSCIPCNQSYGRIEEDFLTRIALCLDPDAPESRGIVEKVMRGLNPARASSERDHRAREAKRQSILNDMMRGSEIPRAATYPGMGERWDRQIEDQVAVTIPVDYVQRITEKIVRGLFYIEGRRLLEPPFEIEHHPLHEEPAKPIRDMITRFGKIHTRPPGLIIHRAVTPEDGVSSFFEITLWGRFRSYASVVRPASSGLAAPVPATPRAAP